MHRPMPGRFVTIEGIDGVRKNKLVGVLADTLPPVRPPGYLHREWGGSAFRGETPYPHPRNEEDGERTRARHWALRQRLLMLGERHLAAGEQSGDDGAWPDALLERAKEIEIAPRRSLADLWFAAHRMWRRRLVHARVRAAARDWPAGHKPQGFLC